MPKNDFDIVRGAFSPWPSEPSREQNAEAEAALNRIAERLEIETGAAEIALAEAARQIRDLEKERDILFKGDWAALNQKLEIAERERDQYEEQRDKVALLALERRDRLEVTEARVKELERERDEWRNRTRNVTEWWERETDRVSELEKFLAHVNDGRLDKAIKLVESDLPLEGIRRERLLGRLLNIRDHAKQVEG